MFSKCKLYLCNTYGGSGVGNGGGGVGGGGGQGGGGEAVAVEAVAGTGVGGGKHNASLGEGEDSGEKSLEWLGRDLVAVFQGVKTSWLK